MKVLLLPEPEVDLYDTLLSSETSRNILRFYEPKRVPSGVLINVSSLGIALSLVSELRWYVQRYIRLVLFEIFEDIFGTHALADEIYRRDIPLEHNWHDRVLLGIKNGMIAKAVQMELDATRQTYEKNFEEMDAVLEVWRFAKEDEDFVINRATE
jgi:hypothetical protein